MSYFLSRHYSITWSSGQPERFSETGKPTMKWIISLISRTISCPRFTGFGVTWKSCLCVISYDVNVNHRYVGHFKPANIEQLNYLGPVSNIYQLRHQYGSIVNVLLISIGMFDKVTRNIYFHLSVINKKVLCKHAPQSAESRLNCMRKLSQSFILSQSFLCSGLIIISLTTMCMY